MELPPGSTVIHLESAPSGHLVMPVDEFAKIVQKRGGVPEAGLALHQIATSTATAATPEQERTATRDQTPVSGPPAPVAQLTFQA